MRFMDVGTLDLMGAECMVMRWHTGEDGFEISPCRHAREPEEFSRMRALRRSDWARDLAAPGSRALPLWLRYRR
jgi:glycine cleavage system aminomethyltransferase T